MTESTGTGSLAAVKKNNTLTHFEENVADKLVLVNPF